MIFRYVDFRVFLRNYINNLPKKGRGQITKMAEALNVNSTLISQVLAGTKTFTYEQAFDLANYLVLPSLEKEYFLCLVQIDKAGKNNLKKYWSDKAEQIKKNSESLSNRLEKDKVLTAAEKSIFYSNPIYSAVRLYTTTSESGVTLEQIMSRFDIDKTSALKIINFLVESQLIKNNNSLFLMGPQKTHLESDSPYIRNYHSAWRLRSVSNVDSLQSSELMYTAPVSLSKKDFDLLREEMLIFIKNFLKTVHESPAEDVACFNLDWFWIRK